jgi:cell division protein FtsZ
MKGAKGVIISITGGEDMRLMEVDEAASHIKELVDPDANIIWGSAFNNDLDGKVRVSVVATGIEADSMVQPQPAKVFTFPSRTVSAPVAPVTDSAEVEASDEEEPLDLTEQVVSEQDGGEELLLDSDDILTTPVGAPPIEPPSDEDDTAAGDEPQEQVAEQPKAATGGGTLFERMSSIARGAPRAQIDDDEPSASFSREPLDIPRFLNRQNNQ